MSKLIQLKDGTENVFPSLYYKEYAITRTENSYADATSVGRIALRRYGQLGLLYFNFRPSTSIPANQGSSVTIGSFNCTLTRQSMATIPCQAITSTLLLTMTTDGIVRVLNGSPTATGTEFFRAVVPVIFTETSA